MNKMSDPVNGPKAGPIICVGGQGYGKHSLKQLLKKHAELERENAALRELLNEPFQFFQFGHKALMPWGEHLDRWCKKAEKFGLKKEELNK